MNNRMYFFTLWNIHTIAESLPISSSGHERLLNNLIAWFYQREPILIGSRTDHLMHITTLLIVAVFLIRHAFSFFDAQTFIHIMICMAIANSITGLWYIFLKNKKPIGMPVYMGFLITAWMLLSLYFVPSSSKSTLSYLDALIIGIAQSISLCRAFHDLLALSSQRCGLAFLPPLLLRFRLLSNGSWHWLL